jgi:hypothetical protein
MVEDIMVGRVSFFWDLQWSVNSLSIKITSWDCAQK